MLGWLVGWCFYIIVAHISVDSNEGSPRLSQYYILLCQHGLCGRTWAGLAHKTVLSSPMLPFLQGDTIWRVLPHQMWQHPTTRGLPGTCSLQCFHPISPGLWRHLSSFTCAERSTGSYATLSQQIRLVSTAWKWGRALPAEKGGCHPLKAF